MIIYSKEPLNVMMKNILLLDDPFAGGYVYVSKETYDQALSLSLTFNNDIGRVKGTISGKGMLNWAANKVVSHVVSLCSEKFCSPINMFAPYLAYTLPIGVEWPENDEEIIRMAYGVLHQMSQFINFYGTALMPATAKADITIPKNIIMSYEDSWKAQLDTLDKCVVAVPVYIDESKPASMASEGSLKKVLSDPEINRVVDSTIEVSDITGGDNQVTDEDNKPNIREEEPATTEGAGTVKEETSKEIEDVSKKETGTADAVEEESASKVDESDGDPGKEESEKEDSEEGEEDDLEARILAMMKQIEEAPAEQFQPKEESKPVEQSKPEVTGTKNEEKKVGESGSINMTEREIAMGNQRVLNDYDI